MSRLKGAIDEDYVKVNSKNLRKAIKAKGLTQAKFVKKYGVTTGTFCSWVTNCRMLKFDREVVAEFLCVSEAYLAGEADE